MHIRTSYPVVTNTRLPRLPLVVSVMHDTVEMGLTTTDLELALLMASFNHVLNPRVL